MEIYYQIYFSEQLQKKKARILRKLKQNRIQPGIYLIVFEQKEKSTLEFFPSLLLKQKRFCLENHMVVGIASGYDEALEMVRDMTDQVYQKTGGTDVCAYLRKEQQAYKEGKKQV